MDKLKTDYKLTVIRVKNGSIVRYRGNSEMFRDMKDKGNVSMMVEGVSAMVYLLTYSFINNIYISKTKNNT